MVLSAVPSGFAGWRRVMAFSGVTSQCEKRGFRRSASQEASEAVSDASARRSFDNASGREDVLPSKLMFPLPSRTHTLVSSIETSNPTYFSMVALLWPDRSNKGPTGELESIARDYQCEVFPRHCTRSVIEPLEVMFFAEHQSSTHGPDTSIAHIGLATHGRFCQPRC
jgi:hypothetical protein